MLQRDLPSQKDGLSVSFCSAGTLLLLCIISFFLTLEYIQLSHISAVSSKHAQVNCILVEDDVDLGLGSRGTAYAIACQQRPKQSSLGTDASLILWTSWGFNCQPIVKIDLILMVLFMTLFMTYCQAPHKGVGRATLIWFTEPMFQQPFLFLTKKTMFAVFVSCQVVRTNQFSVTRHEKIANGLLGDQGLPGVFVLYELSPMMVKLTEKHR